MDDMTCRCGREPTVETTRGPQGAGIYIRCECGRRSKTLWHQGRLTLDDALKIFARVSESWNEANRED